MQTTHLTSIISHFNPLATATAHRIPRLILSRLPSSPIGAGNTPIKITTKILARGTTEPALLTIGFKGGDQLTFVEATRRIEKAERKKLRLEGKVANGETITEETREGVLKEGWLDLGKMGMNDVLEELGRRSRILGRKEQIGGS